MAETSEQTPTLDGRLFALGSPGSQRYIYILKYMDSEMIFFASKISEGILWAEISKLLFIGAEKDDV